MSTHRYNTRFQAKKAAEKAAEKCIIDKNTVVKNNLWISYAEIHDHIRVLQSNVFNSKGNERLDAICTHFEFLQTCPEFWNYYKGFRMAMENKIKDLLDHKIPMEFKRISKGKKNVLDEKKLYRLQEIITTLRNMM